MVRTQISLDQQVYCEARQEADRLGISFAELVRRALAAVLAERIQARRSSRSASPWMRFSGCLESGDPEASTTIDDIVYGPKRP